MPGKPKPKEVRDILSRAISDAMKEAGFLRASTTHLGWYRAIRNSESYVAAFLVLGRYGWSQETGGEFSFQFQEGVEVHPFAHHTRLAWLNQLLSDTARTEALQIHNKIALSLKDPYFERPEWSSLTPEDRSNSIDWGRYGTRVRRTSIDSIEVFEMIYYALDDVRLWAEFLRANIRGITEAFLGRVAT